MKFRKKTSFMSMNYNYPTTIFRSIFAQMYKFLVEKYIFTILLMNFSRSNCTIVNNTRNAFDVGHNTSKYCSQIIVVHVHANGFLFVLLLIKCDR